MLPEETIPLYRPVGRKELELIEASGWTAFPPRLSLQPIFYPVTTEEYAVKIARDWNTKDPASGYAGYVTRFHVRADYLSLFEVQTVGGEACQEYWIPSEQLDEFNAQIVGPIEVIASFEPAEPANFRTAEQPADPAGAGGRGQTDSGPLS